MSSDQKKPAATKVRVGAPAKPQADPRLADAGEFDPATLARKPKPKRTFTVFLDRDGVLDVAPRVVLRSWKAWRWLPGAREALARLNVPQVQVCLCTNQPFATTGLLTPRRLARLHAALLEDVRAHGGRIDRIEAALVPFSRRHKPRPGMLQDGGAALGADPARSVMVGDNVKDAQAARGYGCAAILLHTSHPKAELERRVREAGLHDVPVVPDLAAAVDLILRRV